MNVLIVCPSFAMRGGISNYYRLFQQRYDKQRYSINFFVTGSRNLYIRLGFFKQVEGLFYFVWDFGRLVWTLTVRRIDIVHLNPSMEVKSLLRDGCYLLLVSAFRKRTVVHFRGWLRGTQLWVEANAKKLFLRVFGKGEVIVVLGDSIKVLLVSWGWPAEKIVVSSTMFDENRVVQSAPRNESGTGKKILFMGIFLRQKGIIEVLETFKILIQKVPDLKLVLAGDGPLSEEIKGWIATYSLTDRVELTGFIQGEEKYRILATCDIFLLPTYDEGCPNSILEAMGAGLAIVSRPVGGIPDIVKEGTNGFLVASKDPQDFAVVIEALISDAERFRKIQQNNRTHAFQNYTAQKVVEDIQTVYERAMSEVS